MCDGGHAARPPLPLDLSRRAEPIRTGGFQKPAGQPPGPDREGKMSRLNDVTLFVDQSRRCRSADDLRGLMEGITSEMGFHVYALYQHVRRFDWGNANLLAISNYPRPWLEYLFEHRLDADDPV